MNRNISFDNPINIQNILTTIIVGILCGLLVILMSPGKVVAALGVIVGTYLMIKYDIFFFTAIFAIVCRVINPSLLPVISLGGFSLHAGDFLLFIGFGKLYLRWINGEEFRWGGGLGFAIVAFYVYLLLEVILGHFYYDVQLNILLRVLRIMSFYLLFLFLINMVHDQDKLQKVFLSIEILSVLACVGVLLNAFAGINIQVLANSTGSLSSLGYTTKGITRSFPGSMALVSLTLFYELVKMCIDRTRLTLWSWIVLLMCIIVTGLSFYRSLWVSHGICLMIIFVFLTHSQKVQFLKKSVAILTVLCFLFFGAGLVNEKARGYQKALAERIGTLATGSKLLYSKSLSIRLTENKYAFGKLKENPLFGNGMGNAYRPVNYYTTDNKSWIHNGYLALNIIIKMP